jgi:hypothetical protein
MAKPIEREIRSYWRVAGGAVLFLLSCSLGALVAGSTLAWFWTWLEVGWRAMRWTLGAGG